MDPATASAIAAAVVSLFHRKKKGPNMNAILARYRSTTPQAYTTPADEAMAERARTRLSGAAQSVAEQRRVENARQVTARNLSGPAAAALEQGATDVAARGGEEAARTSADLLYRAGQSNVGYERQKLDTAFGAEMGLASQQAAQGQASDAEFWNSVLGVIPGVAAAYSGQPATSSSAVAAPRRSTAVAPVASYRSAPVTPAQRRVSGPAAAVYR